ncbi:(2S)-3-sulfopropanediol dehydratase [Mailhella sp.]|uniref:(2S)-3-sulfopropanediol dehydratase n=1 Tax=Mailhella sp. TaxID=1981029 RepID=UPI003AB5B06B
MFDSNAASCFSGCDCHEEISLSGQEKRIFGIGEDVFQKEHPRVYNIVQTFDGMEPVIDVERALYFTRSMKQTEGEPLILRWAKALYNIASNITVYIDDYQLIVGRLGCKGRYGIMYPEIEGDFYETFLSKLGEREGGTASISPESMKVIKEEIGPYWKGKTYHENFNRVVPKELHEILFIDDEGTTPRYLVNETASWRSSLQWVHDYGKVIKRGFLDIQREAKERLAALDPNSPADYHEKRPFLEAVVIVSDAIMLWARRHAEKAEEMAAAEQDPVRKKELLLIAENCRQVPAYPAKTFHQAVQSQYFVQMFSRLEQRTGTTISNGRMDQYLYPLFKQDKDKGVLTDAQAMELLECVWCGMAQFIEMYISAQGTSFNQGYAHWEAVTIGGLTPEGEDATNDLSYIFLKSKREFPLHYPDLAARVHARSPERFLSEIAETIKFGTGYPKLLNDEEIIPIMTAKGAPLDQAYDYTASGCTESRMPNRDTYTSGGMYINMPAELELVLNNGRIKKFGDRLLGVETGDPRNLKTWDEFWNAFLTQQTYYLRVAIDIQYITNKMRQKYFAVPMSSSLHDLCMKYCLDLHTEHIPEGYESGLMDYIGYGTLIDSLAAIKKAVYDDKSITMDQLLAALDADFEGYEDIRELLQHCPCYGNNDPYADSIGRAVERHTMDFFEKYGKELGVYIDTRYVPVTAHVPFGRVVSASANGRKAWTPLSDGTSASHGADVNGPTSVLLSNDASKNRDKINRAARMLNIKFSPKAVEGKQGTRRLVDFIRSFIDLKLWHVQFNVINRSTLLAAQKDPKKYRSLIVRVAGYSAYFVDLTPDLQNDLIARTEHSEI